MAKNKAEGGNTYADLHGSLMGMTEPELEAAIDREVNRTDRSPRPDLLGRLIGRFNRLRANRTYLGVMALPTQAGKKDVASVLYRRVIGEKRQNQG